MQFKRAGGLAGDNARVIVGMHRIGPGIGNHLLQHGLACGLSGFAFEYFATITPYCGFFRGGCVIGHDHGGLDAAPGRGKAERRRVVAGGMRGDSVGGASIAQTKYRVTGATRFKSADLLQVFAFEENFSAR